MKYLDRLNQTAEESAKENNKLIAQEKHLDLQKEVIECNRAILAQKRIIEELKSLPALSAREIFKAETKLVILNKELEFTDNLMKELF